MANKRVKHLKFFEALLNVPKKSLPFIFKHCGGEEIHALIELLYNTLNSPCTSAHDKKKLSSHRGLCKKLLATVGNKSRRISVPSARRILSKNSKQVGGFLPLLLLPLIAKAALAGAVSTGTGLAVKAIHDST